MTEIVTTPEVDVISRRTKCMMSCRRWATHDLSIRGSDWISMCRVCARKTIKHEASVRRQPPAGQTAAPDA